MVISDKTVQQKSFSLRSPCQIALKFAKETAQSAFLPNEATNQQVSKITNRWRYAESFPASRDTENVLALGKKKILEFRNNLSSFPGHTRSETPLFFRSKRDPAAGVQKHHWATTHPSPPSQYLYFSFPLPPLPLSLSLPIPIIVNDPFPLLSPYSSSPPPPSLSPYPPEVNTCKRDTHAPKRTYTLIARAYASFWAWVPNYPCGIAHAPIYTALARSDRRHE